MSSATESESDERYRKRYRGCGGHLMMTPRERRWKAYQHNALMELKNVRRWFVKEFPPVLREHVMTFVDKFTVEPIALLEIQIYHPELAKALKPQEHPSSYEERFQAHMGR